MPGIWHQVGLHCRTVDGGLPVRRHRLLLRRYAGRRHRPQRPDRVGVHQPRPGRQRPLLREGDRRPVPAGHRPGAADGHQGDHQGRRRRRRRPHRPAHRPRPDRLRRPRRRPPTSATGPVIDGTLAAGRVVCRVARLDGAGPLGDGGRHLPGRPGVRLRPSSARPRATSRRPSQNLVYADVDGHIGYQAPGLIPIRRASTPGYPPGYLPSPGWEPQWDWQGFLAFEQLPLGLRPGRRGTSSRPTSRSPGRSRPSSPPTGTPGWRSQRINDLVARAGGSTPERMGQIQDDTFNAFAPTLVAALLKIDLSGDPFTGEAQALLQGWDYTQPADDSRSSAAAAYFNAVWTVLVQATFDDQLPADLRADGGGRWWLVVSGLARRPGQRVVGRQADARRSSRTATRSCAGPSCRPGSTSPSRSARRSRTGRGASCTP